MKLRWSGISFLLPLVTFRCPAVSDSLDFDEIWFADLYEFSIVVHLLSIPSLDQSKPDEDTQTKKKKD